MGLLAEYKKILLRLCELPNNGNQLRLWMAKDEYKHLGPSDAEEIANMVMSRNSEMSRKSESTEDFLRAIATRVVERQSQGSA